MRNWIRYAGQDLKDFGVYISGSGTFDAPERDVKTVAIPGRNGELTLDNGRYKNIKVKYPAFIFKHFLKNVEGLRALLLTPSGYQRMEDTYNPDEYRKARYSGGLSVKPLDELIAGKFDLTFDCYPQRYLKSGEEYIIMASGSSILNPTSMTALPLIKMTTTSANGGTFYLGSIAVQCSAGNTTVYIDCELQEAYSSAYVNMNDRITLVHGVFPSLPAGETSLTTVDCTIEIMPRWWRL